MPRRSIGKQFLRVDVIITVRLDRGPPVSNPLSINDADKGERWQMRAASDHDEAMMERSMWGSLVSSLLHRASNSVFAVCGGELGRKRRRGGKG